MDYQNLDSRFEKRKENPVVKQYIKNILYKNKYISNSKNLL